MVGGRKGTVRLEIVPWLSEPFGHRGASRLVLEEEVVEAGDSLVPLPAFSGGAL